ncbi:MAG: NAD(P)/FAD-dependent oxidoreductase [Anaerolineae bacterium]|nr:NAD(P)/FAD-dependent oxidoreductase [Gemmatimonadaceae bacterium]
MAESAGGRRLLRVVILGGGFAGLTAARTLRSVPVEVTLVDRTNHHIFQPLLYQVATAMLAPTDITAPIRWILRKQRNTRVVMAEVHSVDIVRRIVLLDGDVEVPYDFLIVATGSRHAYFGHDEWEADAPGLKSITDALNMRQRFLMAFEEAEKCEDAAARAAWQTFVVIGGGPTGVELAGMLPEIARGALRSDFRRIDTRQTRVILLEGGPGILVSFPQELSLRAARDLAELGVEVRTNALVTRVEQDAVFIGDDRIATRTVFWAAGNVSSPLGSWLDAPLDRAGRVEVEPDLSVPNHPEVFVVGDMAAVVQDGKLVPGVAPAANQEGRTAAKNIARTIEGKPRRNFRYVNKGNLATIGRSRAIAEFGSVHFAGRLAWVMWLGVHIMYLVGFRNRLSVLLQWGYAYFTYQRGARLIVEAKTDNQSPSTG